MAFSEIVGWLGINSTQKESIFFLQMKASMFGRWQFQLILLPRQDLAGCHLKKLKWTDFWSSHNVWLIKMGNSDPIFSAVLPNDLKLMVQLWNDWSLQPGETFQGSSWQHAFSKAQFFYAVHEFCRWRSECFHFFLAPFKSWKMSARFANFEHQTWFSRSLE